MLSLFTQCLMACVCLQQDAATVDLLITVLSDAKEPGNRIQAAKTLGELGSRAKTAVPALIAALKDGNGDVRGYAVEALGRIGPDAAAAVIPLLNLASQPGGEHDVTGAIILIGKGAVPVLVAEAKNSPPSSSRAHYAVYLLGEIGPEAREAIPALTDSLKAKQVSVDAARSLLRIDPQNEKAVDALFESLKSPEEIPGSALAPSLLVRTKRKMELLPFVIKALKERDPDPKEAPWHLMGAAVILWKLGPDAKEAAPILTKRLKELDPDADVVLPKVAGALLKIDPGNQPARQTLIRLIPWIKNDLLTNAHVLKEKVIPISPALIEEMLFPIEVSKLLGPDAKPLIPALEELLAAENRAVREAAAAALKAVREDKK